MAVCRDSKSGASMPCKNRARCDSVPALLAQLAVEDVEAVGQAVELDVGINQAYGVAVSFVADDYVGERVATVIGKGFERAGRAMQSVIDVKNAIALIPEVELRKRYAAAAWRYFDVLRGYHDESLMPPSGMTWIVAVPFAVESPEMMLGTSPSAFRPLCDRELREAFTKNRDPACPRLSPMIHVVPMSRTVFMGAATYGYMLANPRDRVVDKFVMPAWRQEASSYRSKKYFAPSFFYLFTVTEPGLTDEEQMAPHHALPQSPWMDQQMAVLGAHVASVKNQMARLGVRLGQPMRRLTAVIKSTRHRLARQL